MQHTINTYLCIGPINKARQSFCHALPMSLIHLRNKAARSKIAIDLILIAEIAHTLFCIHIRVCGCGQMRA